MPTFPDCSTLNDRQIIAHTIEDPAFFACVIDHYERRLLVFITRITGLPKEQNEEILQEAFINVYRNIHSYNPLLKFSSWIYRIARNEAINAHRKNSVRPHAHSVSIDNSAAPLILTDEHDITMQISDRDEIKSIYRFIHKLSEKERTVAFLRFTEDKDYEEMSDIMKIPIGTISAMIRRIRAKIALHLRQDGAVAKQERGT